MRVLPIVWIAAAGVATLTACAPAIRSQRDEAIPVPHGATWAWAPTPDTGAPVERSEREPQARERQAVPRGSSDATAARAIPRQRFERALASALEAKGLRRVADRSSADFLLTVAIEGPGRPGPARVGTGVGVGWYGGFGRWGWYRPWGLWAPWGGYYWHPWAFGWYGAPYWGWAAYPAYPVYYGREATVVAVLSRRDGGDVAWRAQYRADAYDLAYMTQRHVREIADKLVATLR